MKLWRTISSWITTDAYFLNRCLPAGYFEQFISQHYPLEELRADNNLVHRADAGALACMPPQAREDLARTRSQEGRELSGVTGLSRIWSQDRQFIKTSCRVRAIHAGRQEVLSTARRSSPRRMPELTVISANLWR